VTAARARLEAAIRRLDAAAERLRTAEERARASAVASGGVSPSEMDVYLAAYLAAITKDEAKEMKAALDEIRPKRRA
jgi:hypothetical protein